jgi:hypothetical protein
VSTPVTVTVANGGTPLPAGSYKLIGKGASGTVATLPGGTLIVNGDGAAAAASLQINDGELYLVVCTPTTVGPVSPASQAVCAGGTATFTVPAPGGSGPFHYQWLKNGSTPVGTDSSSYTINPVTGGDAGTYDCVVTGACAPNATATGGTLTLTPEPLITSITVSGTDVTLVWTAVAGQKYRVQYTADLVGYPPGSSWTDLTPDVTATGSTATKTDSVGGTTHRFYRIAVVCP